MEDDEIISEKNLIYRTRIIEGLRRCHREDELIRVREEIICGLKVFKGG